MCRTPSGEYVFSAYAEVVSALRSNEFSRDLEANADPAASSTRARRTVRETAREAKTILNLDPPDHTRLRRLVSKAFTPTAIERLRPRVGQLVDDVLDRAAARGGLELVDDLAFPVPFQVISDLLAMPTDRAEEMRAWSQLLTATLEPTATDDELDAGQAAAGQMAWHLTEVIESRRRDLGDDVLSALIAVEDDGDTLSHAELVVFVLLLYVAGHETTVNLIANGCWALLRHRDQLADWRAHPEIGPAAVDELLRFDGPVQLTARTPLTAVRVGDTEIPAGATVFALLGSANHDPAMFTDPERLDLRRPNAARHVAFSAGIHYCLGAALARLEAEEAIGRLIRRFEVLEPESPPTWRDRVTIRGVDHLPLRIR